MPTVTARTERWLKQKVTAAVVAAAAQLVVKVTSFSLPVPDQHLLKLTDRTNVSDSSGDDDIGPAMPSSAPKKKRRVLPYEKLYISALPSSPRYSKSLMHKEQLSFVTMTPFTDFLITSSVDGVVKFWKKVAVGIEAVKEFRAHIGEIKSVSVSQDGRSYATAGGDKTIKIFDVVTFGTLRYGATLAAEDLAHLPPQTFS